MSQSSFSFAVSSTEARCTNALLVRDVDGQYRVASADEVLSQAWGVLGEEGGHRQEPTTAVGRRIGGLHPVVGGSGRRGDPVVRGEHRVDKGILRVEAIEDGAVLPDEMRQDLDVVVVARSTGVRLATSSILATAQSARDWCRSPVSIGWRIAFHRPSRRACALPRSTRSTSSGVLPVLRR